MFQMLFIISASVICISDALQQFVIVFLNSDFFIDATNVYKCNQSVLFVYIGFIYLLC
jgi:hypothetical protein